MSSEEWVTLQNAALRVNFKGIQGYEATRGLCAAIRDGEIGTREVQVKGHRMVELRTADVDTWLNKIQGTQTKNKGGRPPEYDWLQVYMEIIKIANTPDGLPERQSQLIKQMIEWTEKNWGKSPDEGMLKKHISAIYAHLKKGH